MNDLKEGFGKYTWASGNVYTGEFRADEREGYGEMNWVDGSSYRGEWVKSIQHGFGKMIFPNGSFKEGFFENNIFKYETSITDQKGNPLRTLDLNRSPK